MYLHITCNTDAFGIYAGNKTAGRPWVGPCFMQIPTPTPLPQSLNIRGVIFFFKNIDPPRPLPLVIRVMKLISEILYVHVQSKSMSKKLAAIEPN